MAKLGLLLVLSYFIYQTQSDYFSSIDSMEKLLRTQKYATQFLNRYTRDRQETLVVLKEILDHYKIENKKARINYTIENPLNYFRSVKRLTFDLEEVEEIISENADSKVMSKLRKNKKSLPFPTKHDLKGAVTALNRLQRTYKLKMTSMTKGEINGYHASSKLTIADCALLIENADMDGFKDQAKAWLKEAENVLKRDANITLKEATKNKNKGFFKNKFPDDIKAVSYIIDYQRLVPKISKEKLDESNEDIMYTRKFDELNNALCRKQIEQPIHILSKLKCRYVKRNNPFLLIAPFKVEQVSRNPDVVIFHDVLSDEEIELINELARPKLKKIIIYDSEGKIIEYAKVGKRAFLKNLEDGYLKTLEQRVGDMTGLDMKNAEDWQVINYGIGGLDSTHYDWKAWNIHDGKVVPQTEDHDSTTRTATVLFYLSTVQKGGYTVFPVSRARIYPRKGTAAVWYNLLPSGEGNVRNIHTACPVLIGNKWVATKWIREKGQEFIRPCPLKRPKYEGDLDLVEVLPK